MSYRESPAPHPLIYIREDKALAVERETGRTIWTFECPRRIVRMLLAYECVYLLDMDCTIHCMRAHDGTRLGAVQAGEKAWWGAALLAEDGLVYVATTGGVTALSPEGKQKWQMTLPPGGSGALPGLGVPGHVCQPDFKE